MAQTTKTADELWAEAAVARKFGVHNGKPLVSSSFETKGFIAGVIAPTWFSHVPADERPGVCQALLEFRQNRLGQTSGAKSTGEYSRAVNGPLTETDDTVRDKDAIGVAAKSHITCRVLEVKPDATMEQIKATIAAKGAEYAEKNRDAYLTDGYPVPPKGERKTKASAAVPI